MTEQGCTDCARDLEHCHGSWIEHADGTSSCADDDCGVPAAGHALAGGCADLLDGCGCRPAPAVERRAA